MKGLTSLSYPVLLITIILTLGLTGCEKEGTAEKMGKQLDQAVEETKEDLQQAKEKIEDTVKK